MTNFICNRCPFTGEVNDDLAGKTTSCPKCGEIVQVAASVPSEVQPQPEDPLDFTGKGSYSDPKSEKSRRGAGRAGIPTGAVGLVLVIIGAVAKLVQYAIWYDQRPSIYDGLFSGLLFLGGIALVLVIIGGIISLIGSISGSGRGAGIVGFMLGGGLAALFMFGNYLGWR